MKRRQLVSSGFSNGLEALESRRFLSLTTQLVSVPISAAAIAKDPNLANFKTFDVQVKLDPGEKWISMDLLAKLTKGTFYNVTPANGGANVAQASIWGILPNVEFDTFVAGPGFSAPIVLGQYSPTLKNGGTFSSTETNVSFGVIPPAGSGTFTVARLTVTKDATGTVVGQDSSDQTPAFQPKQFQFNINNGSNVVLSSISGTVFNDGNGNGKFDSGEAGIPNWKLYIDKDNDGTLDSGEKFRLTDATGGYSFDALTPGTYYVRQTTPTGFRRTFPSKSSYTCVLSSGVNGTGKNFGNTNKALLSGTVFNDKDSDAKKDSGEGGLAGFRIFLDTDKDGALDSGEKFADSDANGYWVFKALNSGTYTVRILPKAGYKTIGQTNFSIKLAPGGQYTGRLFAEHKT